jgi:hypothetical protein
MNPYSPPPNSPNQARSPQALSPQLRTPKSRATPPQPDLRKIVPTPVLAPRIITADHTTQKPTTLATHSPTQRA